MTQFKRFAAFLLCFLMIFPTQELMILAETTSMEYERIEEMPSSDIIEDGADRMEDTQPSETVKDGTDRVEENQPSETIEDGTDRMEENQPSETVEDGTDRIEETLPLEPMEDGADRIEETLPLEPIEGGGGRIKETLPLEPLEDDGHAIYWNPGGQLPAELATASNAAATVSNATPSRAKMGKDSANGLSPTKPVKTLKKAIERAKDLMEKEGLDPSDITIYAMNPMEVADGELYVLNAGNIRIASWPERPYESDALFYVNGGQLTLTNVLLEAENPDHDPDETELVYVRGGVLQMGQNVNINGCVVMDYCSEQEDIEWKEDTASPSNAANTDNTAAAENERIEKTLPLQPLASTASQAKGAGEAAFDIDNYVLDTDEDNVELIVDKMSASTWRDPIIELMEGFDGGSGEYLLELRDDGKAESRELVTTLYADDATEEEFLGYFTLAESDNWNLEVETEAAAQLRDTGSENKIMSRSFAFEADTLTSKTLIASRSLGEAKVIYWNPGAAMTIDGEIYPAGDDVLYDGSNPRAPLKTWSAAAEEAKKSNGMVVAMRSLNLGDDNAGEYLEQLSDGEFYLASAEASLITPLGTWNSTAQPAIIVPENKTLIVENLYLGGMYDNSGNETEAQTILVNEGDLIIEKNVRTEEKGYIQINAFLDLANHPVQVCSVDSIHDGDLRIFFGDINKNVAYRYVDVVIPGGDLASSITDDADPIAKADSVGQALLGRIKLHSTNRSVANGGLSSIDWSLRQDTAEDDSIVNAQNIELYAIYYFDGIYIDGVDGDDRNYGASCDYPVKTWARARAIWQDEMTKSLQARQDAAGMTLDKIEADYPMPEVIYICNTVTVDSASEPEWELEPRYDYARGTDVKTEVVSHIDKIASQGEGSVNVPRHETPKTLIKVTGSGVLSIRDVFIRNMVDDTDSVTIKVEAGGTLNLRGETTLNGTRLKSTGFDQKDVTLGNHVTVTGGSRFVMEAGWTGSIENREQGVVAAGSGTTVEMNNGFIQKNNSYRADYYTAGITTHKAGGGVVLSDGARFTMNGGTITGNQTYQYGAGVYLVDAGTSFIMNKGKITGNSILTYQISGTNSTVLFSKGVGIFADTGTIVNIGDGNGEQEDTVISNNKSYFAYGTGIYTNGSLNIDHAAISDNEAGGVYKSYTNVNLGVGIYIGADGKLAMNAGLVNGNHGAFTTYGYVRGVGIYIDAGTNSHTITGSTITTNQTGYEYYTDSDIYNYNQGGGIYLAGGNTLTITDTTVSNNRAGRGGGIYASGSSGKNIALTLKETIIEENKAISYRTSSYGDSGGIYFYGYGTLTLEDGTKIINNSATVSTGGLYIGGYSTTTAHAYMMATTPGAIEISGNKITAGSYGTYGGGVTHNGGSWHAENVRISNNEAVTQGGGIYSTSSTSYSYFRNMMISDNRAGDGAALAISSGRYYMKDSSITDNTATNRGGGIYTSSTSAYVYLSETEDGKFELKDNHADYGGGIAITTGYSFMMDIAGPIQNSAAVQGSNFYLSGYAYIDIFNGHFKQPVPLKQVEGVYNIYIDDTSTSTYSKYFDFSKVTADKKDGANPDVIFLNSGSSFLTVLAAPLDDNTAYGAFPIDLNSDVFQSGSVVLKPLGSAANRAMMEPNDDLSAATQVNRQYPALMSAMGNLDHFRGGELPRRSELGGFRDAVNTTRTNVIIVGQGVYLAGYKSDGTGGNDSNGGTSPADAVATFERAKEVLKNRINEAVIHDGTLPEEEREGFAPFIYICGQVDINTNESWELNYDDPLYTDINEYYAIAEERNGTPVYEPQVRRFASFVRQPMIKVGNGSNTVSFTTGRLIIDGMADTVVLADQSSYSPVIYGSAGTLVTLTGDSMIRNNYYSALDIYGKVTLSGEIGEVNKQLYNNQSQCTVRLYGSAKMSMLGEAKIITDNTVEKVASFSGYAIWMGGTNVSVSMEGNSAIMQGPGSTLLNSYLIYSTYANTSVQMKENARLEVGNAVSGAIYISGSDSTIDMTEDASIATLDGAYWQYGIYGCANFSLTMSDRANITYGGYRSTTTYGIYLAPTSTTTASVKMQDHAAIILDSTATGTSYWFYGISVNNGISPKIEMLNNSRITGNPNVMSLTCGIITNSSNAKDVMILLNMEADGSEEESVSITDMSHGIYLGAAENSTVSMGKKALIAGGADGIYLTGRSSTTSTADILMKDHSRIYKTTYGIYFYLVNSSPINIRMEDHAAIEQNNMGIAEATATGSTTYGASQVNVEMFGNSRISGNSGSGIQLVHTQNNWSESTGYQKITLNDNAMIGGSDYYSSTDAASGNQGAGIYANGPIQVTMNGTAKISGNGTSVNNGSTASSGIYLTRSTTASYHRAGTARITLNDSASICDNKGGGVYAATIGDSTTSYHNEVIIELNGIKDDGSFSTPSIQGNTDAVYLGADATLRLKGEALVKISDSPYASSSYVARVIDNYGYIELDGRSTVKGLIYMNNSTKPITMTHAATGQAPKYDLHLVEGFAGKTVVQPDLVGIMDLTGMGSQLAYFHKASADGMAASRPIVELSPNLVLLGENNVYLSGNGNDANTGNTPSTAVKTFKRARELLRGGGYYTTGANIIICTSTVNVLAEDDDWSFDPGGFVTNSLSGQRWQPLVTRYDGYGGILITLYDSTDSTSTVYASTVTFKNITIDGGSANGILLTTAVNDQLLMVGRGRTAVLLEGAVLQNNKAVTAAYSNASALGVKIYGGTLEINGGTIRNIVRETSGSFSSCYFASVVMVQGVSTAYPGNLIMKSGQIINNELKAPNAQSTSARIGTIYIHSTTSAPSGMEMRGGLIENNKIVSRDTNPGAAGAIVNYDGTVTISGGIIRGNEGGCGSAIFHQGISSSSQMIFSGGQISQNTTNASGQQSINKYSPIFVMQKGFELRGGGADISDNIYLYQTLSAIKVSDHIYQTGRSYHIYLNQGTSYFRKGSVVVEPDGNKVTNVGSYLPYFDVRSNPYVLDRGRTSNLAGSVSGVKEEQCLILMKAVYLDSVNGKDTNTGLKPSQAVKSFTKAKSVGVLTTHGTTEHYVIYVCGKAINTSSESVWTLPETAYMCRYTGFPVYESDGTETPELERAYYGCLIQPDYNLTFKDITIQGRRGTDSTVSNGDSLVNILTGISVTVESGAAFSNNNNSGNYIAEDGFVDNLDSKGGAFQVAERGILTINGGEIKGNNATYGSAIYLHASESNPSSLGQMYLSGSPVISGKVYLNGTADITSAYIQPDATYVPSTALQISVSNDYNGRPLIRYKDGTVPGETQLKYYSFDDAINALYDIVNNSSNASILELSLRRVIYLDGQSGSDDESHDGTTPEKAFKTLKRTFEAIGYQAGTNGVLIYIVDTLDITGGASEPSDIQLMNIKVYNSNGSSHYEGYYKDPDETVNIRGQVYFKRYSQPKGYDAADPVYDGYSNETLLDSLFYIGNGGKLTLSGIYLDGHSISSDSMNPTLVAPAVVAQSPLITVKGSGVLQCYRAEGVSNGVPTATLFINNYNTKNKNGPEYVVGHLNDSDIMEGTSAGIELLDEGTCFLEYTEFSNLALGDQVISGGTDVYSNGYLHFSRYTNFGGSVFLEGFGTKEANHDTSRYLTVDVYGTPIQNNFHVMVRDSYMGRDMVHYQVGINATVNDAGYFLLEERVKDFFCLSNRSGYPHILELQVPVAVYIDGANGIDDQGDRFAGSTPKFPVKTLARAFELLKTRGGNTIYVVGTIQVNSDIQMTGQSYIGTGGAVMLGSTNKINIVRYIQPDFAVQDPVAGAAAEYDVEDYTGALLNVRDGATAQFSANVYFDGHSEPKTSIDLPIGAIVSRNGEAKAPLITVEKGGALSLLSNVTLYNNNNTYDQENDLNGQHGGAILNSGTATVDGTLFENNKAAKGSVVYQDGTFTIVSAPEKLDGHQNTFYLTSVNTGTAESPVWGTDHVIQTAVEIPKNQIFDIDMDHAVKGRDVVQFTSSLAYDPNADAEHEHFRLGSTVPENLFLVEAESNPDVLELQDWEVLKVEVPADIYLVVRRRGSYDSTNKLMSVNDSSAGMDLFTAPEYTIKNKGIYDAKVSITGFENQTMVAGITTDPAYLMNLTASAAVTTAENDLYLAVKGLDDAIGGTGFDIAETSLQHYAESTVTAAPIVLGTLKTQTSGNFTFIGAVGNGFVDKYMDASFPIEGSTKAEVQKYMDGTSDSGVINARAKYLLKYKVEILPSRRTP
ncbi:hypothetical protein [Lacrimispora sp.]|uniref:hypothetical protein n=1 Tax=Lacrimispora sp. TaxID=2719234 RepID=UPI0028AB46DD|nr:hypothetical protein [Lacrimispora sp.]